MKRFSPCTTYKMNGKLRYASIAPDGEKKDSATWHADRINEIRYIFLQKNKNNQFRLKPYQKEIMTSILSGNDTFVILPTGSGKSLCFQAPSVFFPGITLVITPLVALIENQVDNFNKNAYPLYHPYAKNYYENIRFKAIYPGMDGLSARDMFSEIRSPRENGRHGREIQYKFLYVSPERLGNPKFSRMLERAEDDGLQISHIVIDEVHCLSQWGFEFRESYLYIANFISQRPIRPIISAFTATATPKDIAEIKNILHFPMDQAQYAVRKYREIFHMTKRENLSLKVLPCSDYEARDDSDSRNARTAPLKTRFDTLIGILEQNPSRVCIIYRTTASGVDELYHALRGNALLKDRVAKYHAQMPEQARRRNKSRFEKAGPSLESCKNIMIATKAFGMGIDKKDISLIIHYDVPRSLEDYYQEVGRAGRDMEKVPMADCYLLYSVGPKYQKGTLQYTVNWVTSGRDAPGSGCMPVSSQFSGEMKENIYFWSYYRLCYVMKYCNIANKNPGAAHGFILKYLENRFSAKQIAADLDYFYRYIVNYYPVPPGKRERFLTECLFRGADAGRFSEDGSGQAGQGPDRYRAEIRRLTEEVNELHINNTYLANLLRHHPERYQPDMPYVLSEDAPGSGQEWKGGQNKRKPHELTFVIHGGERLSYFDLCVLDAVYSIEAAHKGTIYVQTIWEILTGRNPEYSSQEKLLFRQKIQDSIDRMRAMAISISDNQCDYEAKEAVFLPLTDRPKRQKGYSYSAVPPLFLYAEEMNGQIVRVPVSLLNTALWKNDFRAEFRLLAPEGCRSLNGIRIHPFSLSPSPENALLCHYLIHRIAISKNTRRGNFILFLTIRSVTGICEDILVFNQKTVALLNHYRKIGYFKQYHLYITDYQYRLADGTALTGTARFRVKAAHIVKYWRSSAAGHLLLSDFPLAWSGQGHERLRLSADTE